MPDVIYNGTLDIATGRSRKETAWKNKEILWSDLIKRLSITHRTAETHDEYLAAKRPRQDEIKDIGGFVGGHLAGGRRKSGSVTHRQLLTLDIDHGSAGLWEDYIMLYDNAAAIYSTHKHSPELPRLRLIIPLSRAVMADEYVAIARKIAGLINIQAFDPTTYQPERLMYWPSTSSDGQYFFDSQDGPWLDPDQVLASYRDWRDSSEWPVADRESAIVLRAIKKQGDPLEKPGVIGAFCRTYSITEAIDTYLADIYEPCDTPGRYSYREGSTAAGLVVYEDKYAFSHHGTDPVSSKLCNAFDLVRIHKYGLKDEDAREGVPGNKLPSYLEMMNLASQDPEVKMQLGIEQIASAKYDFAGIDSDEITPEDNGEWMKVLKVDKRGLYLSTIDNIYVILKNDKRLKGSLCFDEFERRLIATRDLPWRKVAKSTRDFSDDDSDCLAHYLECYNMPFTHVQKALAKIRTDYKTHPVREYLSSIKWDGVKRLDTLFIDYLGAENTPYTRSATRKTLVAAVARVFNPGCQFDTVLTLIGAEGIGKSTIISKLAGEWFSDCLGDIHTKEGMESLRGVWIMEIAELASFRKADQEAIKRFITSREDIYRPAYGKQQVRFLRQCIFIASTNKDAFLSGAHKHRRFLPMSTYVQDPGKSVFKHFTKKEIDQVWAEALAYYNQGESLDLSEELKVMAEKIRELHTEVDERSGLVEKYLNTLLPENWDRLGIHDRRSFLAGDELQAEGVVQRKFVCVAEVWCEVLGGMQKDMTQNNTKYIHDILRKMKGWIPIKTSKRFGVYGTQRAYENVNTKILAVNTVNTNVNTN